MGDGEERQETANPGPDIVQAAETIAATAAVAALVAKRYAVRSAALSLSSFVAPLLSPLAVAAVAGLGGAAVVGLGVTAWNAYTASSSSQSPLHVSYQEPTYHQKRTYHQEWTYHQKRTFTFNVDASQDPYGTNKAGIGGVLKNENGEILYKLCEPMELKDDINIAELTAIKRALEVFSNNKSKWVGLYDELIVANDNETAVRLAKGVLLYRETSVRLAKGEDQSLLLPLLDDIQTLVSAIGEVGFIKVDEYDIREADKLANQGRNL